MSIVRRVVDGPSAEVRYCCTIFSEMYEKRRRDAPGTFRNPARKIRHLLVQRTQIVRRVFVYLRKKDINCTTCLDTWAKIMSILRRVLTHVRKNILILRRAFEGQNAEVRYCCTNFSKKYMTNVDETLLEPSAPRKGFIDRASYHSRVRTP